MLDGAAEQAPADLKGKKISFGEIGSTSPHLAPATLLAEAGLVYGTDYEPVFLKRNVAMEALIAGKIAAIGVNKTHIDQITEKFPDQKLRILVKGPELPNDVLLASATVKPEVIEAVRKAFVTMATNCWRLSLRLTPTPSSSAAALTPPSRTPTMTKFAKCTKTSA